MHVLGPVTIQISMNLWIYGWIHMAVVSGGRIGFKVINQCLAGPRNAKREMRNEKRQRVRAYVEPW